MDNDEYWKDWKLELQFQNTTFLYEVGDKVRYKGKEALIKKIEHENFRKEVKLEIAFVDDPTDVVIVTEDDITLVHKAKPEAQKKCECGQWSDKAFNTGEWHSDWCPMHPDNVNKSTGYPWRW